MLTCEAHDCREFFEFDEVAADPIDAWSIRAAAQAESDGWVIGHTGLVKCPKCTSTAIEIEMNDRKMRLEQSADALIAAHE